MGRYEGKSTMSSEELIEFTKRYSPPYTKDKFLRFYLSRTLLIFPILFKFYLVFFLFFGFLTLVIMGVVYFPLLIVIAGAIVYLFGKRKKSKLK